LATPDALRNAILPALPKYDFLPVEGVTGGIIVEGVTGGVTGGVIVEVGIFNLPSTILSRAFRLANPAPPPSFTFSSFTFSSFTFSSFHYTIFKY